MGLKIASLCVLVLIFKFSTQLHQNFKCNEHIRELTSFHRSGVLFNSGPHFICQLENIVQVSDVNNLIDEMSVVGLNGHVTKEPHEVGAIKFKKSELMRIPTKVFQKFPNLLSFCACEVQMRIITRDDFVEAHNLTKLLLKGNLISELEDGTFTSMKKLQQLDLSRNLITTINEGTFAGVSENLYKVDLSFNKIKVLDFSTLTPLAHPKKLSVELNLDANAIKDVKESHRVSHLVFEVLSLRENFLHTFSCPDIKISELHLDNNELETMSFDNCSVEYLAIPRNNLKWLHFHGDLRGLIAGKNRIESFVVSGESKMYHLDLSENGEVENTFPTLKSMEQIQYLNLSNSIVGILHEDTFQKMSDLKYLYLKNSSIQIIPFGIFDNNKHLMTLDLSDNDLETVDLHMFTGLDKLKTLNLSGNQLSQIEGIEKIKSVLPELKEIGISRNGWKCVNLSMMIRTLSQQGIHVSGDSLLRQTDDDKHISGVNCY